MLLAPQSQTRTLSDGRRGCVAYAAAAPRFTSLLQTFPGFVAEDAADSSENQDPVGLPSSSKSAVRQAACKRSRASAASCSKACSARLLHEQSFAFCGVCGVGEVEMRRNAFLRRCRFRIVVHVRPLRHQPTCLVRGAILHHVTAPIYLPYPRIKQSEEKLFAARDQRGPSRLRSPMSFVKLDALVTHFKRCRTMGYRDNGLVRQSAQVL